MAKKFNIYGVYGQVNEKLNTDEFCIQKDISLETNGDYSKILHYMLSHSLWEDNDRDYHWGIDLMSRKDVKSDNHFDVLDIPEESEGSKLRTTLKTPDGKNEIYGGIYLRDPSMVKLSNLVSHIYTHKELDRYDKARTFSILPYEVLLFENNVNFIWNKIGEDTLKRHYSNKEEPSKFYTKKERDAMKELDIPRIEFSHNCELVAVTPSGIVMPIEDLCGDDLVLSLIFFLHRGYRYISTRKMFCIVLPSDYSSKRITTAVDKIMKTILADNVTVVFDDEITMKQ